MNGQSNLRIFFLIQLADFQNNRYGAGTCDDYPGHPASRDGCSHLLAERSFRFGVKRAEGISGENGFRMLLQCFDPASVHFLVYIEGVEEIDESQHNPFDDDVYMVVNEIDLAAKGPSENIAREKIVTVSDLLHSGRISHLRIRLPVLRISNTSRRETKPRKGGLTRDEKFVPLLHQALLDTAAKIERVVRKKVCFLPPDNRIDEMIWLVLDDDRD